MLIRTTAALRHTSITTAINEGQKAGTDLAAIR
jgi:hypothetical protein